MNDIPSGDLVSVPSRVTGAQKWTEKKKLVYVPTTRVMHLHAHANTHTLPWLSSKLAEAPF